jgi:hypothetical protein
MLECVRTRIQFSPIENFPAWGMFPIEEIARRRAPVFASILPHLLWNILKIERVRSQTNARMAQIAIRPRGFERTLDATTTLDNVIGVLVKPTRSTHLARFFN